MVALDLMAFIVSRKVGVSLQIDDELADATVREQLGFHELEWPEQ
jgi:hypothetical protein